ncbi:sensor histidine kinase [Pelagibacterium luteolum]|uniref:histidine kinase n=1 Tax=Pelagibacterium luteolum TaxID=440168 RepID=A0A1G7WDF7_9HYPH|nr:histidine kinase dimerization/phosphoacceptor domain -containing protein [Pelagibacterium luteolum]SDG69983.1 Two-component sensor histidine kinase, contains HisKA and HATPase domains [Pelagibacterium luteolum]
MTETSERAERSFLRRLLDTHGTKLGWGFGVVAFAVAFLLRDILDGTLPPGYPFLTFFPAVILTAFVGGLAPGIAVAVLSTIASWYFFIPPFDTFAITDATALALGFFVVIMTVDLAVIHYMFRSMGALESERQKSRELARSRDLMFEEMQHRISNNLAVVSALLRMQRNSVDDEGARKALDEAATRLALIGNIHRKLHDPNGQQLPFGTFIKELCHDIVDASGTGGKVVCMVEADELFLSAERAVPVGLILTEVVSNALEHAFEGRERGTISIDLRREADEGVLLTIADDGKGLPEGFELRQARSLGLVVAQRFAEQIGAVFSMENRNGAFTRLRFANG